MTRTVTIDPAATFVALVNDSTPESLEYGTYRGWVALDSDGGWLENLTQEQVDAAGANWEYTTEYERLGRIK